MLCLLTASFTSVYTIFVNVHLFFEAVHVMFNGRNGSPLQSMISEYFAAWLIVGVVKYLIRMVRKCRKTGNYHKSRDDILLGLSLIAFFSILGKILIGINYENQSNAATFVYFPVNGFFASYFLLVHLPSGKFYWNTKSVSRVYEVFLVILVFVHAGFFMKTIADGIGYKYPQFFLVVQFWYSLICASSTCDILAILMGKLEKKSEELQQSGCVIELEGSGSPSSVLISTRPSMFTHAP